MKITLVVLLGVLVSLTSRAQSKSYQTLHDHFHHEQDVHTFQASGFIIRLVLNLAAKDESAAHSMAKHVRHARVMVIPKEAFEKQHLSVSGFQHVLEQDSFMNLVTLREKGDVISIYHRMDDNNRNRYFVLVDGKDEVVAIEMKGYIDPELLAKNDLRISLHR